MKKILIFTFTIIFIFFLSSCSVKKDKVVEVNDVPIIKKVINKKTFYHEGRCDDFNNMLREVMINDEDKDTANILYNFHVDNENVMHADGANYDDVRFYYDFVPKSIGDAKVYLEKKDEDGNLLKKVYFGDFIVTDDNYTGFEFINSAEEFYLKIENDKNGKFILGSDLDFSNTTLKTIDKFNGYLINPNKYKIKNIVNGNCSMFNEFGGYLDGIIFEDCTYKLNNDISLLYEKNIDMKGFINNIKYNNCLIEVEDYVETKVTINIAQANYINKCSFEGKIISKNAPIDFIFFGCNNWGGSESVYERISVMKNSYCILDMEECNMSNSYTFNSYHLSSTYNVLKGDLDLNYDMDCYYDGVTNYINVNDIKLDSSEHFHKYWRFNFVSIYELQNCKFTDLDAFTFVEGQYPYIE